MIKINKFGVKLWPVAVYLLFCAIIISTFIYHAPSWGLMDDCQHLGRAESVFKSNSIFIGLKNIIVSDLVGWGMFRPVYFIWVAFTYHIFKDSPLTIYIIIAVFNLLTFVLWGYLFHVLFYVQKEDWRQHIFFFPLIFSVFTPLWNNFIYISVQQKFIVTFSALAILYFFKAYTAGKKRYIGLALLFSLLSIGVHPEGIFLVAAFTGCIIIEAAVKRKLEVISLINFLIYTILFIIYFIFSFKVQMEGVYTKGYKGSFNLEGIFASIFGASIVVKGMFLTAVIVLISVCLRALFRRNDRFKEHIILPLSVISYIIILAPWGFPNYHLSTLAPFVFGIFFPLYILMNKRLKILRYMNSVLIIVFSFTACVSIAMPRIAKMGQIREVRDFIKSHHSLNPKGIYFTSPPLYEAADALSYFTGAKVVYLIQGKFNNCDLHGNVDNYLILSNESVVLPLAGVRVGEQIYYNDTWRIFKVSKENNYSDNFFVSFKKNPFQSLVLYLR